MRALATPGTEVLEGAIMLCSGADDGDIRIWDVARSQSTSVIKAHQGSIQALAGCVESRSLLVSATSENHALLWDLRQKSGAVATLAAPIAGAINTLKMNAEGSKVYGGTSGKVIPIFASENVHTYARMHACIKTRP